MVFGFGKGISLGITETDSVGVMNYIGTKRFKIDRVITIGHAKGNSIVLKSSGVDDIHCQLYVVGSKLFLENLSRSVVLMSDKMRQPDPSQKIKVSERREVKKGQHFFVGNAEIFISGFSPA